MTAAALAPVPPTADAWRELPPRERYARAAVAALPRLVGLLDRNPLSRSYGSFDRAWWHYRTMDFPCGMAQEMVLPLALAYAWDLPGGEAWRGNPRVRSWVVAAMQFARRSSHADGTCDDYFPFERAMGALVFSLYAMTESCLALDLHKTATVEDGYPELLAFFRKRGDHLGRANETGQLANHQALAALALHNVHLLTDDAKYREFADKRLALTLSWQHEEGWFQEYEGADPGYHSCSIDFLAKLWQKSRDERIPPALRRATEFAAHFMHPDGSYAGEYGSRNTYHFYPHGFEVMAGMGDARAAWIADMFVGRALPEASRYFNDDDRMAAHYVYNWMQAWRDRRPDAERAPAEPLPEAPPTAYFPAAGLVVRRAAGTHAVVNVRKGGVLKVVREAGAIASDTGPMLRFAGGTVLVTHLMDPETRAAVDLDAGTIRIEGRFSRRKHHLPSPWAQIAFRLMTLTIGRFSANAVRATLQKVLITGKKRSAWRFERHIAFRPGGAVEVRDIVIAPKDAPRPTDLVVAPDTTSIYVANSQTFQRSVLLPEFNYRAEVATLERHGRATLVRLYGA